MATSGVDTTIAARGVEMKAGGGSSHDRRTKINTRFKNGKKIRVIHKLDEEQVRWIMRQKANGQMSNAKIAELMGVSDRWVRKLWSRYKSAPPEDITWPPRMGRPVDGLPGRREHSAVLSCCSQSRRMAVRLETIIERSVGIHISHHTIHGILKDEELAENQPAKAKQRKWIRYERRYSNSLWHTDYKQLPDGRWFVSFQDDASRLVVGFGVFDEATSDHAIKVLEDAIKRYGKPAQVLTDRGSQFYANEKENAKRGMATFETKLVELDIKHVLARVRHPQTNGKLERFHLEIEQHLKSFEEESASNTVRNVGPGDHVGSPFHAAGVTDPTARLVDWYNDLPHMSLMDGRETPAEAYVRKQAPKDITAEEMGRTCMPNPRRNYLPDSTDIDENIKTLKSLSTAIRNTLLTSLMVKRERVGAVVELYDELFKHVPPTIVTTNYDNVLETYCEQKTLDLANGFKKSHLGDMRTWDDEWKERGKINLTKIHGSITWQEDDGAVLEVGRPGMRDAGKDVMIVPTLGEKDYSHGIFPALQTRFKSLLADAGLLIVVGFSFRDAGINKIFRRRLTRSVGNPRPMRLLYVGPKSATEPDGLKKLIGGDVGPHKTRGSSCVLWNYSRGDMPYVYAYREKFEDAAKHMKLVLDDLDLMCGRAPFN